MLEFIGNGSAFNTKLGNNSAYIKEDNYLFLIDCGSNIFDRLRSSGILDGIENIEVLITHFHPDHIGSLGDLIFYSHYVLNVKMLIYTPQSDELTDILNKMGVSESLYDIVPLSDGESDFLIGTELWMTPILTSHVDDLSCYGYILEYREIKDKEYNLGDKVEYNYRTSYYSGDSNIIPNEILDMFTKREIEDIYQDTCSKDYDGNVHLSLRRLQEYIELSQRHRVHCMHLDEEFDSKWAKFLGFNVTSNILELPDSLDSLFPPSPLPLYTHIGDAMQKGAHEIGQAMKSIKLSLDK